MATTHPQQLVDKYELLDEVGQGGMAVVYRGRDTNLNREVAVKILHTHLAEDEESRERFHREANAVAKLRHRNIIEIYDYSGIDSERSYIVTEFIHGETLREYLQRHPISHPEIAAMIVVEVCRALAHAHAIGIIHRDIKPENIMIRDDGLVKLTDFGIAQVVDIQRLTVTGQLLGSPAYMAPELVEGKRIDYRTDVFSVGTLLYQLATSEMPFKGNNPHELLKRISEGRFLDPEVANPVVGGKLGKIIRKSLAHDPDARYLDVRSLMEDLLGFLEDVDIDAPREELAAYFSGPRRYSQELQERVVEVLSRKGLEAMERRRIPQALEIFNRVLCVDPTNREVLSVLERLHRRQRISRVVGAVVLMLLLGEAGFVVHWQWPGLVATMIEGLREMSSAAVAPEKQDAAPSLSGDGKTEPDRGLAADAAPSPDLAPAPDLAAPDRRRRVTPRPKPAPPPPQTVEINPTPKRMSVWLDGKRIGALGPDLREVTIPGKGSHTLLFKNPFCFDQIMRIEEGQRLTSPLNVKLRWKPAHLTVVTRPEVPADVVVHGNVYRPGQVIEVPIDSENGRDKVKIEVSAEGYSKVVKRVPVTANHDDRVTVPLESR